MENTNITIGTIGTAKVGCNEVTVKVVAIEENSYLVESIASHRQFKTQHLTPQVILRQPEAPPAGRGPASQGGKRAEGDVARPRGGIARGRGRRADLQRNHRKAEEQGILPERRNAEADSLQRFFPRHRKERQRIPVPQKYRTQSRL